MDGSRPLVWLMLVVGLVSASGANCPQMLRRTTEPPPPRVLPPSPTLEQVIQAVNANNAQIHSFSSNQATITGQGMPTLRASVAFEWPRRFRLRAETGLTGPEFDLGSNDEIFWFWLRRNEPPTVFYCRHDQFAACQARRMLAIDPEWIIEALGTQPLDPNLPHQGPFPLAGDRLEIRTVRETPGGPVTKVTIIDAARAWIVEQHLYNAQNQLTASSITEHHRRDPLSGLTMPTIARINCPQAGFSMRLDLGNVKVNYLSGNPGELWTMPVYQNSAIVNLADPRFQPPPGALGAR